ncbi:MAG: hypothetical protein Q8P91_01340 [bacterium]|nr:hypothetical protein [bacterium]
MKKITVVLLCLAAIIFGFQASKDTDFGWHFRCGKELLAGRPCIENNYSYFLPDYKAYYPGFVYDTFLAINYNYFGFNGLSLVNSLILLLSVIFLYRLLKGPFWLKVILPLFVLLTPGPSITIGLRPQVVSFLFFLLTLNINLYLLPLLFVLWVNTHIGFIAGMLLLPGIFLKHKLRNLRHIILPFLLILTATFINPFGPKVYLEIFRHLQAPLATTIAEWVAPPLWLKGVIFFLVLELILFLHLRKQLTWSAFTNLFIFTILSYLGIRNLIFLSVFLAIYFSRCIPDKKIPGRRPALLAIPAILIFLAFFSRNLHKTVSFNSNWKNYCSNGQIPYPCEFVNKYPDLKGNVFAMYEWGGFLIWKLPDIKVFADGRTPSWLDENGKSTYEVLLAIVQAQPGWNEKLTETKTDYILIGPGTFLDLKLSEDPGKYQWKQLYRDNTAVLYSKI